MYNCTGYLVGRDKSQHLNRYVVGHEEVYRNVGIDYNRGTRVSSLMSAERIKFEVGLCTNCTFLPFYVSLQKEEVQAVDLCINISFGHIALFEKKKDTHKHSSKYWDNNSKYTIYKACRKVNQTF